MAQQEQTVGVNDSGILVDQQWLARHGRDPEVVLVDVRSGADYWRGHLAGARHLDISLFSHYDTSAAGLRALAAQFEWVYSALGIGGDEHVVFYEQRSDSRAARAAWLLEFLGHGRVSILDGGLSALRDAPLTIDVPPYAPRRLAAQADPAVVIGYEEILARRGDAGLQILDTRRAAEYYGQEVRARRAGALPGALHRDYAANIDEAGRFRPASELREAFAALGLRPDREVAVYCGGGVRAAHSYYALKLAGYRTPRNYTGSWGEWGNREDLPVDLPRQPAAA